MKRYAANSSPIDSGDLDRVITWYAPLSTQSTTGYAVVSMASQGSDRAYRVDMINDRISLGLEKVFEGAEMASNNDTWIVRFRSDVRAGWELEENSVRYTVSGPPEEIGRRMYLSVKTKRIE